MQNTANVNSRQYQDKNSLVIHFQTKVCYIIFTTVYVNAKVCFG